MFVIRLLSLFVCFFLSVRIFSGTIDGIDASKSRINNNKILNIHFYQDLEKPRLKISNDNTKLTLFFDNSDISIPKNYLSFNDSVLQSVSFNTNKVKKSSTIFIGFLTPISYKINIRNQNLVLSFQSKENVINNKKNKSNNIISFFETNKENDVTALFKRGAKDEGIINLNFSKGININPNIKKTINTLEFKFNDIPLNPNYQKKYDVSDFKNIIRSFHLLRIGNATVLRIFLSNPQFSYKTKKLGNNYQLVISPSVDLYNNDLSGSKTSRKKFFHGKKLSLDFQDVNIRTILQIIAKESGYNIIVSDKVVGKMTISLNDVPWDQALDLIIKSKNLEMKKQGNIIHIAPMVEFVAQEKELLNSEKEISESGILKSRVFHVNYRKVKDIQNMIKGSTGGSSSRDKSNILSSRGSVMVDEVSNTIIVTDNEQVLKKIANLLKEIDTPVRQVLIEARIVEANDDFSRDLGMRFGGTMIKGNTSYGGYGDAPTFDITNYEDGYFGKKKQTYKMPANINLPASHNTGITILKSMSSGIIGLELLAMEQEKKGKIISSPKVLTQDRQEASLEEGRDYPYNEATSSGASATTFKKAVTGLKVTPNITPDGHIIMKININKDSIISNDGQMSVKRIDTNAMVQNGETLILGGIYVEDSSDIVDKVPLLGDIPLVGNAFKRKNKVKTRRELLYFITPKIVDQETINQ